MTLAQIHVSLSSAIQIATLLSVTTGFSALIISMAIARRQVYTELFMKYAERYQRILDGFPKEAIQARFKLSSTPEPSTELRLCVLKYLNLCSEELHLKNEKFLPDSVWKIWEVDIKRMIASPIVSREWETLKPEFLSHREFVLFLEKTLSDRSANGSRRRRDIKSFFRKRPISVTKQFHKVTGCGCIISSFYIPNFEAPPMFERPLMALAAVVCLFAPSLAHADQYAYQTLYNSDGASFTAVDNYGDYVILDVKSVCADDDPCYYGSVGGKTFGRVDTAPVLPSNPSTPAGPGCTATSAGVQTVHTICNNGYEFLIAYASHNVDLASIYSASDTQDPLGLVFDNSAFTLTSNGSLYFDEGPNDTLGRVLDVTTTTATTPEPSSIALLGTGLLGVAGVVKRRFA